MGTPDFSVPILKRIITEGHEVAAVITQPDRPKGRKKQLTPPPVKEEAQKHDIPVLQPEKIRQSEAFQEILAYDPDIAVTAAFGQMLPKALLDGPPYGCINVHASLLPAYRGGAPIHRAIIDGQAKTGVTIMYMVEKMDAGDILAQTEVSIGCTDNVGSMHDKLSAAGADLLADTLPKLAAEQVTPVSQDDEKVSFAPNIKRQEEKINWNQDGKAIYNRIRGLDPWPGAYTLNQGQNIKLWRAEIVQQKADAVPGTVIAIDEASFLVQAGDDTAIRILALQPAGKKRMTSEQYLKGAHLQAGDLFGEHG